MLCYKAILLLLTYNIVLNQSIKISLFWIRAFLRWHNAFQSNLLFKLHVLSLYIYHSWTFIGFYWDLSFILLFCLILVVAQFTFTSFEVCIIEISQNNIPRNPKAV